MTSAGGSPSSGRRRALRAALTLPILALLVWTGAALMRARRAQAPPQPERSTAPAADSEMRAFTFDQTRKGEPLYRLKGARLVGTDAGVYTLEKIEHLEIHRPSGMLDLAAPKGRIVTSQGELVSARLEGGVTGVSENGDRFEAPAADYDASTMILRAEAPVTLHSAGCTASGTAMEASIRDNVTHLAGPVQAACAEGPLSGATLIAASLTAGGEPRRLDLEGGVRAVREPEWIEARSATLSERGHHAEFEGPVRGSGAAVAGARPEQAATFEAQTMKASQSAGNESLVGLSGAARISGRDPKGAPVTIEAPEIEAAFGADRALRRMVATGGAVATQVKDGRPSTIRAPRIEAEWKSGALGGATASGGAAIASKDLRGSAETARLEGDTISLAGGRPEVRSGRAQVTGERIESDREGSVIRADGEVRSLLSPRAGAAKTAGTAGFEGGKPLLVESASARLDTKAGRSLFEGSVRARQEGRVLTADRLESDDRQGTAHATGSVTVRGRQPGGKRGDAPFTLSAPAASWSRESGESVFSGGALWQDPETTLAADTIRSIPGPSETTTYRAETRVRFENGSRRGTGESALWDPAGHSVELHGGSGPARLEDSESGAHAVASALTLDLEAGTIAATAADGARTVVVPGTVRRTGD